MRPGMHETASTANGTANGTANHGAAFESSSPLFLNCCIDFLSLDPFLFLAVRIERCTFGIWTRWS